MSAPKRSEERYFQDLEKYYKLRKEYEHKYTREKNKIMANTNYKSLDEKRNKIKQIKVPCSSCKRKVGMIFSNKNNTLQAMCGNRDDPCKLNFTLNRYRIVRHRNLIDALNNECNKNMVDIIKIKLDLLFNFKTQTSATSEFEELRDTFAGNKKLLDNYRSSYQDIVDKKTKEDRIQKLTNALNNHVQEIKELMELFHKKPKSQLPKEVATIYQTKVLPILSDLQKLLYSVQYVEYDSVENTHKLVQEAISLSELEIFIKQKS